MKATDQLKETVRQKYQAIAGNTATHADCCGPTSCCNAEIDANVPIAMAEDYKELNGYLADADLGLGCGLPTQFAQIRPGETVVDLGSGAGNDCFVARAETGETGRVIGLDMTPAMIDRARKNAKVRGFKNVEFVYGDIEDMPLPDDLADVVVSNCVMNLVPDKAAAFAETFRILKPGGHFSISDIVLVGDLPEGLRNDAEMYAGCVSGAIQKDEYLKTIADRGFTNILVQKQRIIHIPDSVLENYLSAQEIADYSTQDRDHLVRGIYSITVYAEKPFKSCCGPDCCN